MSRIAIVAIDDCYLASVGAMADAAQIANSFSLSRQEIGRAGRPIPSSFRSIGLQVDTLSVDGRPVRATNGAPVDTAGAIPHNGADYSCIYLPAFNFRQRTRLARRLTHYRALYPWLIEQRQRGALIAANGASVFLLAEAGLLDGRLATIGWWLESDFRKRYPHVFMDTSRAITESDEVFCANTLSGALDLACRILERLCPPAVVQMTAEIVFSLADGTKGQSPVARNAVEIRDPLLAKAHFWLSRNYAGKATLERLSKYTGASERTLIRRFRLILGTTPHAYLKRMRLDNARLLLETTRLPIAQVAAQVGYEDVDFFKKSFKAHTGVSAESLRGKAPTGRAG